jgi:ribosomal-protein-alanine N-acetyltransferase
MTVRVRPMTAADIPLLLEIESDLFGREAWSEALFRSELAEVESRAYFVAVDDGEIIGYAGLCSYVDDAWLQTLAVRRDRQRHGTGRLLLEHVLAEADRRGPTAVGLEVRADNEAAQALYRGYGFAQIGRRRGYYQPSNVDAVIMQRAGG